MANSETVTSTSNTAGGEYQVFLSFRGPDTRLSFTDILHKALVDARIRVFIDDVGLQPGEKISNLLQVIDNCKLYIPIFSKDYASSHWCLDELAKMVENTSKHKEDGKEKVILPIFYDVKPKDVKLQTPLYKDVISNLEQEMEDQEHKFSSENIKTWRESLVEVGGIKGWEVEKHSSPLKLIQAIVDKVVAKLLTKRRRVTGDFVGMEDQIANIKKLLDIDSDDVQFIGIYGMGGIGKTTLAKTIFNELCPRFGRNCSFLDDVRETAKNKNMVELQKKLLSDISYSGVAHKINKIDEGIDTIEATISNKKVLIVLDDVDEVNQILQLIGEKSLHRGSRILVTTRDKNVLTKRKLKYEFKDYEMMGLIGKDAFKLFSRHAFNEDSPPADYCAFSKGIVDTTCGLPLALQAIGSSLFGKKRELWEEWLERLKKTSHEDVLAKLKISYDALHQNEKQIFLDIACYFAGRKKTNPMYVWKDCNLYPKDAMDVLINRCMIKELDNNRLWMHDQFRDLGRKIAKEERIGLWDKHDIIHKLRSAEIKESVQALNLPWSYYHGAIVTSVTSKQIKRFPRLRFLCSDEVIYLGDFTGCLSELKWIRLCYSRCYKRLEATNLLHLENVVVANLYGIEITKDLLDSLIKGARKLKVLTIENSTSMSGTLTFSECSNLEKLKFFIYASLMESDRWLRNLSSDYCSVLKKLPEQIGEIQNLRHVCFDGWDRLIKLLGSVSKLKLLTKLDVHWIPIPEMPDITGKFHVLHKLDLDYCHEIQEWPKLPISLTTLRVESILLLTIPNLSYLTNLVELVLSEGSEFREASNVIQTCDLRWIGMLSKLRKLYLRFSNVCAPTTQLDSLSLLKELTVHGIGLPAFKQLPPNLIDLELYETRGKQVHLGGLPPSEKETLFLSTSSGKSRESKVYQQLDVQFLDVLESSERSRIQDFQSSERLVCLPGEPGCSEPQSPELTDHGREVFLFPSSQKMLVKFILSGFAEVQDIQFVTAFESLEEFYVKECFSLKSLGGLSNSKNLKQLEIDQCPSLKVVEGIDELEFLGDLEIKYCGSVGRILDPLSSKIPDNCSIAILGSGEFPDCRTCEFGYRPDRWKSYREKILNGAKQAWSFETETTDSKTETGDSLQNLNGANQAWNSETETTDSETETGDSLQKTGQKNKEKKMKKETESAKEQEKRKEKRA